MAEMYATETVNRLRKLQTNASDRLASAVMAADCFFFSRRTEAKLGIIFFEFRCAAVDVDAYAG